MDYPWYEIASKEHPISQGDLILNCPVVVPVHFETSDVKEKDKLPVRVIKFDIVVMSQSCDLINEKVEMVVVCPFSPFNELEDIKGKGKGKRKDIFSKLKNGLKIGNHLLNKIPFNGLKTKGKR